MITRDLRDGLPRRRRRGRRSAGRPPRRGRSWRRTRRCRPRCRSRRRWARQGQPTRRRGPPGTAVGIVLPDPGEAEVVQPVLEVPRLVLVVAHSVGPRPRVRVGPREAGRSQRQRGNREEEEQEMEKRMHPDVLELAPLPASRPLSE
jgi:hypothetical protein